MFAPPETLQTEVFTRIPDRYRGHGRTSRWVEVQRHGAPTDCFIEGPSFDVEGNLYVVDIPYGRIFRIDPDGNVDLYCEYDGEPNGLKIHRDGRIFVADYRRGLMVIEPGTRKVVPLLERDTMDHFKGLNDLFFAANGDLYFTDQGGTGWHDPTGRLYRLRTSGQLDRLLDNVPSPNGLLLNAQENTVYLAVTRANAVWRVPLLPDGRVYKVGTFIQLSGGGGPDGMAIDIAGNLIIAHLGLGTVWVFSPLGEPLYRIRSCRGLATTNVAFGGPDCQTLYITESESGCILTARLPTAGRALFSHHRAEAKQ